MVLRRTAPRYGPKSVMRVSFSPQLPVLVTSCSSLKWHKHPHGRWPLFSLSVCLVVFNGMPSISREQS